MERFIHHENLRHFRELLTRTTSVSESKRIVKLIEEEELKYRAAVDARAQKQQSVAPDSAHKTSRRARR